MVICTAGLCVAAFALTFVMGMSVFVAGIVQHSAGLIVAGAVIVVAAIVIVITSNFLYKSETGGEL